MEIREKQYYMQHLKNKLQNETEKKLENEIKLQEQNAENESIKLIRKMNLKILETTI